MDNKEKKDTRSRSYQLVINNPADKGYTHDNIKEKLASLSSLKYWCMADEIGLDTVDEEGNTQNGTPHTHIFILGKNQIRFSTIKSLFPEAHIEECFAKPQTNKEYVQKSGKWANDPKHDTSIPDTFEEWGEIPPDRQGHRTDLDILYHQIEIGMTTGQILKANPSNLLYIQHIERARSVILQEKYQTEYRMQLKENVFYLQGPTGSGKSKYVFEHHEAADIYRVTDYKHPFDGYTTQPVLVLEEFRSSLPCGDVLNYLDIYPATMLPARYTQKIACYTTVYIISNWDFDNQYDNVKNDNPATYDAWVRRVSKILDFDEDGDIKEYTTDEYLNGFHPVSDKVIPFTKEPAEPKRLDLPLTDGFLKASPEDMDIFE